jgi:glutathione S-transferase
MVVSAGSQVPVVGMANILRFIGRLFGPELCGGGSPLVAAQVDSWLDLVTYQVVNGSVRSQGSVVRQLNSRLGSSKWLAGESFTLADLYAFVTLCELTGQKIPGNVQKWAKRCLEMPALASLPGCSADHLFPTN